MNGNDLDFFIKELWEPSLSPNTEVPPMLRDSGSFVISKVYPVELSVWLEYGADIGFFDKLRAKALLKDEAEVLALCRAALPKELQERIAPQRWIPPTVNERSHAIFRHQMLMTSELMGDRGANAFLGILLAYTNDEWADVISADKMWLGSLELVCGGFGRVLAHLDSVRSFPPKTVEDNELRNMLCEIQTPRLGLDSASRVLRYFEFAGAVLAQYELPLEKIDVERVIVREMHRTLSGWPRVIRTVFETPKIDAEECWQVFMGKRAESRSNARTRLKTLP
jgi:hypothetical protein